MKLKKARIQNYRSIIDTGWFDLESDKTILVGPNEAGKTAILQALQKINAPQGTKGFDALRDFPRSKYNQITRGAIDPKDVTVVEVEFNLDADDIAELPAGFEKATYRTGRKLDNSGWHTIENGPKRPTYVDFEKDIKRLCAHVDARQGAQDEEQPTDPLPSSRLQEMVANWPKGNITLGTERCGNIRSWLESVLPLVDENNGTEEARYDRLMALAQVEADYAESLSILDERVPVFVLFNNYFRVRPLIHLRKLAERQESEAFEDDQFDYGNLCLLKLLGFSARELSELGDAAEPSSSDSGSLQEYRDQLDKRQYQLNAAELQLTSEIRSVWLPDQSKGEADKLRLRADGQYLKAVVEDDLGVEIELDQRSEGFQWLVSFFVVFFAEAQDEHENAILLLDEPGMSLHALKQRDFRQTVSRLSEKNQTLFTTHSPFLVGPEELDRVRVVEMTSRKEGTQVHTSVSAGDPAALLPLQEALGYDLAQSLFTQRRNFILEGLTDYWYIDAVSALLRSAEIASLDQKIALVPASTAGKVVYYATILHAQGLKVAALLDSDQAGNQAAQQETLVHTLGNKRILRTADYQTGTVNKPEIEDMLRDTLVLVAKDDLGWDISAKMDSSDERPLVSIFSSEIKDFSKYKLAKAFLRWTRLHEASDLSATERDQWARLIEAVNAALK